MGVSSKPPTAVLAFHSLSCRACSCARQPLLVLHLGFSTNPALGCCTQRGTSSRGGCFYRPRVIPTPTLCSFDVSTVKQDATRNLPPSPGHSDASFSPSTSAAPTVQEEPPRVFLSDPGPVSATASARRSRFLSSSWHISETVVDQSSSPADGAEKLVAAGVAAAGGGSASPAAAFDPLGMSLGDNDKAVCDESDFGHTSGGGHDGDEGERKQNSVREHAASSAACSSAQHSADTYGGTERRKTAAASGPEASEKEKPSSPSASLTRSSETADGCGDVTVSEEKPLSPSASLTRSSETADGCGDVTVSEENEEKEMRVAVAVSAAVKVDCDARSGGAGGGGAGGTRRRERRNATKFSDDVIGKVVYFLRESVGDNFVLSQIDVGDNSPRKPGASRTM